MLTVSRESGRNVVARPLWHYANEWKRVCRFGLDCDSVSQLRFKFIDMSLSYFRSSSRLRGLPC
jgi:hypothetical protein